MTEPKVAPSAVDKHASSSQVAQSVIDKHASSSQVAPSAVDRHDSRPAKRPVIAFVEAAVQERLVTGLQTMRIDLAPARVRQLTEFLRALHQVNQVHNLTAIRDPLEMVGKHILDSLSVASYINTDHLLDIGSGGGMPGVPLLLAGFVEQVTLVDSVGKKMQAVRDIADLLGVTAQVHATHSRVEDMKIGLARRQVISRAFASLDRFSALAGHLVCPGGQLLAMKGQMPASEIAELETSQAARSGVDKLTSKAARSAVQKPTWRVQATHVLSVPFVEGERCLVVLERQ